MGLLKDQDVLHFKDVLQFFSLLHAPKPHRASVKLFHLISWSFPAAELCHPREGWVCPLSSLAEPVGLHGGISRVASSSYSSFTELQTHTGAGAWQSLCWLCEVQVSSVTSPPRSGGVKIRSSPLWENFSVVSSQIPSTPGRTPCTVDSGLPNSPTVLCGNLSLTVSIDCSNNSKHCF